VVVESSKGEGKLFEVESGREVARFPKPRSVSPKADVIVLDTPDPELIRISDGKHVRVRLDPSPPNLERQWLTCSARHQNVVLMVETREGEVLVATPEDAKLETFISSPLPFAPDTNARRGVIPSDDRTWHFVSDAHSIGGGRPWFLGPGEPCLRAQLQDGGTVRCLEYAGSPRVRRWLSGQWAVVSAFGNDSLTHASWAGQVDDIEVGEGPCWAPLTLASPPRAFIQCKKVSALVAPDGVHRVDGVPPVTGLTGADAGPVVPLVSNEDGAKKTAEQWLDLTEKKIWQTEPLRPIGVAAFAGVGEIALAQGDGTKDVFVLNFRKGSRELLGEIDDCPGQLSELGEHQDHEEPRTPRYLVLGCLTPPAPNSVTQYVIWSEVLDIASRIRYRSARLPEVLFDDGWVVLSDRRRLSAESRATMGPLHTVRIP
jgi:hypothetical protein